MIKPISSSILLSIFICLLLHSTISKAAIISVSQFGIRPGIQNNTEGFLALSKWLKGKQHITINFLKGTYIVGLQKPSNKQKVVDNIDHIFSIEDCQDIIINGNGAKLKFANQLMYGSFDIITKQKLTHTGSFFKGENAAYPGNCIFISRSKNIRLSNFNLDGNCINFKIGGIYGDNGIQLWHRGIYIKESTQLVLQKLNIHHFGLDGIEISNSDNKLNAIDNKIALTNIRCTYNGRQGLSWTGGNGLFARDCIFSNTGKANIASNPGYGLDIEPEQANCTNGTFINCKFEDNTNYAFGSDYFKLKIENILFDKCTFGGSGGGALFPSNGGVTIDHSIIYGQIVRPSGLSNSERVIIKNSSIYDYNPVTNIFPKFATNHLIDAGGLRSYFDFISCQFYLKKVKLCYIETGLKDEINLPLFKNNKVHFAYESFAKNDFIALFRGCILEDNEFIIENNRLKSNGNYLLFQHTIIKKGENKITGQNADIGWNSSSGPKVLPR